MCGGGQKEAKAPDAAPPADAPPADAPPPPAEEKAPEAPKEAEKAPEAPKEPEAAKKSAKAAAPKGGASQIKGTASLGLTSKTGKTGGVAPTPGAKLVKDTNQPSLALMKSPTVADCHRLSSIVGDKNPRIFHSLIGFKSKPKRKAKQAKAKA
uniref:Uncharacterized protein n=1 Tax=Romanomermis culicivorax TaxID=13658 RepID=A0A915L726_ROMCU